MSTAPALVQPNPEDITREMINDLGLTAKQQGQWEDTLSLMIYVCPGFRHLLFRLLDNHKGRFACIPSDAIPVAATDGKNILVNPDAFFKYELRERVFILGHEIVHNVYNDVDFLHRCRKSGTVPMSDGTTLPFDEKAMQHAMDYRINALLKEGDIGKAPKDCLLDDKIATSQDSVVDVYKKVYEDYEKNGNLGKDGFDVVLIPGTSTGQSPSAAAQNQQVWQIEVKTAQKLEEMKNKGNIPAGLKRLFEEILNPQIPWIDKIRSIVSRKTGSGTYTWRKPDRRFIVRDIYIPSRSGFGAGHIVVWGDTSGSMGDKELCHTMAELTSIMEDTRPERLTVIWCDAAIHRIDELESPSDMAQLTYDAAKDGVGGGGGTRVNPVFEWIDNLERKPEMFIGFTDGYVDFPAAEPDYLCIWASTSKKPSDYPWGDVVEININARD